MQTYFCVSDKNQIVLYTGIPEPAAKLRIRREKKGRIKTKGYFIRALPRTGCKTTDSRGEKGDWNLKGTGEKEKGDRRRIGKAAGAYGRFQMVPSWVASKLLSLVLRANTTCT
jgi:hypothetical protein